MPQVLTEQEGKHSSHLYAAQYFCAQPRSTAFIHYWDESTGLFRVVPDVPTCAPRPLAPPPALPWPFSRAPLVSCCLHTHACPNLSRAGAPGPDGSFKVHYPYNVAENAGRVGGPQGRAFLDRTNLHVLASQGGVLAWARGVPQQVANQVQLGVPSVDTSKIPELGAAQVL